MKHIIDDTIAEPEVRWPAGYFCTVPVLAKLFNVTWQEVRTSEHLAGLVGATIEDALARKAKRDARQKQALAEIAEIDRGLI